MVAGPPMVASLASLLASVGVVATPADATCPSREDLAVALMDRAPAGIAGWVVTYAVEPDQAPPPVRIRFELHDDEGRMRLRRELTVTDGNCAAAADGLAIIVERYFESVAWTAAAPLPVEVERPSVVPLPAAGPSASRRGWELQVGLAGRRDGSTIPGVAIDGRAPLGRGWWAAAGLELPLGGLSRPLAEGRVHLDGLPLRASVRWRGMRGAMAFDAGPAVAVTVQRATGTPAFANGSVYRGLLAVGAVAAARWWWSPGWAVGLEVEGDLTLYAPPYVAAGQGEVLAPAPVSLLGLVAVSRAFSP